MIWAIERLHQFLFGRFFTVRTDHKCLSHVLNGSFTGSKAPARIVRWSYRLLPYTFNVQYVTGRTNYIADALSRRPVEEANSNEQTVSTCIITNDFGLVTVPELLQATGEDRMLKEVMELVKDEWRSKVDVELKPYYLVRHELSIMDDLLFRGERVVAPVIVRSRLIHHAHQGHVGIIKVKQNLRR